MNCKIFFVTQTIYDNPIFCNMNLLKKMANELNLKETKLIDASYKLSQNGFGGVISNLIRSSRINLLK